MKRREFVFNITLPLAFTMPALAQQPERTWRVGVLAPSQPAASRFRQSMVPELAELGFAEGRNLTFHILSADENYERLPSLARDLVEAQPDIIIAVASTTAIRAAQAATNTIPIVMAFGGEDPIAAGWAESYARPGGNVTGIVMLSPELEAKRLQIFSDAFPMRRRLAVLGLPGMRNSPNDRAIQAAAEKIGLEVLPFYVADPAEYKAAFAAIRAAKVEGIAVSSNPIFSTNAARLAELAVEAGLPIICEWRNMVEKGCLLGYSAKLSELWKRVAEYVARILRGTPAGELPIEEPTRFELTVNLRTAKALGIELPAILLARADEVIE